MENLMVVFKTHAYFQMLAEVQNTIIIVRGA